MPTHKESVALISPPWLLDTNGAAYMGVFGKALNDLETKIHDASLAHMPGHSDASAIPFQAADRGLMQGPGETDDQFTLRLQNALDTWAHAGSKRSIISQVHAYLTNMQPGVNANLPEVVIEGGNTTYSVWDRFRIGYAQDAAPDHVVKTPSSSYWDWDGTYLPWRAWLIVFMYDVATGLTGTAGTIASLGGSGVSGVTTGFATLTGLSGLTSANLLDFIHITGPGAANNIGAWQIVRIVSATSCVVASINPVIVLPEPANGSLEWFVGHYPFMRPAPVLGAPSAVLGQGSLGVQMSSGLPATDSIESIRSLLRTWKSASAYYPNIIVSFGGAVTGGEFSPDSTPGFGNPNGTWGTLGTNVNGVWTRTRFPTDLFTCFPPGTGRYFQCSQENVT